MLGTKRLCKGETLTSPYTPRAVAPEGVVTARGKLLTFVIVQGHVLELATHGLAEAFH